jgi:hypothetical protein
MGNFMQDLRYGLRVLAKSPGFTAVTVLSLTLGIGANTTIFTLTKAIFLQSMAVKDPSRVVSLYSTAQNAAALCRNTCPRRFPTRLTTAIRTTFSPARRSPSSLG